MKNVDLVVETLDAEWVALMLEAKNLGLETEDIRAFLENGTI